MASSTTVLARASARPAQNIACSVIDAITSATLVSGPVGAGPPASRLAPAERGYDTGQRGP
jgi:hypothetical protein